MSDNYKMQDTEKAYFVTLTVIDWVDIFSRKSYKLLIVESLKHCQKTKGLEIYGWCLMSNHLHMIVKAVGRQSLPEILRDFKNSLRRALLQRFMILMKAGVIGCSIVLNTGVNI